LVDLSWIFRGFVVDLSWICRGSFVDLSWIFRRFVVDFKNVCLAGLATICRRLSVDHLWIICGFFVDLSSIVGLVDGNRPPYIILYIYVILHTSSISSGVCGHPGRAQRATDPYLTTLLPSSPGTCHPQPESIPTYT
jgi:hypothetical protein